MKDDVIALHEAGHVLALVGSGIGQEFQQAQVGAFIHAGQPMLGLTQRSGASLLAFSTKIGGLAAQPKAYLKFMLGEACKVCFPHVCFFCGGAALEESLNSTGTGSQERFKIDLQNLKTLVLPAMGLAQVSDEDFSFVWKCGLEAVKGMAETEKNLVQALWAELGKRHALDGAGLQKLLAGLKPAPIVEGKAYGDALEKINAWYQTAFMKQNPWASAV